MNPLIKVSAVCFSFAEHIILEDITFNINEQDFIAVIGPNGSGKSTLLKIVLKYLKPQSGVVDYAINKRDIGYVPQYYTKNINFPATVQEILQVKNDRVIEQTGIASLLPKKFITLSGGQQQRVLIAFALLYNPKLLILDEPTAGVDLHAKQAFYALLKQLNSSGITIIIATHEIGVLPPLVKHVLCINNKICCMGTPQQMPQLLQEMYGEHFVHFHAAHGT